MGSSFAPCRPSVDPNAPVITQKASISPSDVHVLLVDDEQISRTLVSSLLRRCNYSVTTAENGAEALSMLRASPRGTFQLILTDICMPELNGIELLQCIKKDEDLRSVPVVMMSSIDQEDTVFECVQRGAEEYLVKPVTRKEVVHMWQHVLRSRSAAATVPQAAGGVVVHAEAVQDAKSQKVNSTSKETSEMYYNSEKTFKCQMESNSTEDRTVEQTQTDVVGLQHVTINQLQDAELKMMQQFLHSMKSSRLQEAGELRSEIETLDLDVTEVRLLLEGKQQSSVEDASQSPQKKQRQMPLDERSAGALEQLYFQRRWRQSREGFLESLSKDIGVLARRSRLTVAASLRNGDMAIPQEMVCCADFDADDAFFATVSISRRVKVYENVLQQQTLVHYPVWQATTTRSKLSSVSWSSYVRPHLLTADYDGSIVLWDVSTGCTASAEASHFDEHTRRVWSLQFSTLDPLRFVSGSDDGTMRLWNVHQEESVGIMRTPVNVCSVQFSPTNANIVAAGCANHKIYLFDLRRMDAPSAVITGPQKAVSYVRFTSDGNSIVAASTDSVIRSYDAAACLGNAPTQTLMLDGTTTPAAAPSAIYRGHCNERNFVGLSVSPQGYILSGSEDNCVYCYWKTLPFPVAVHSLGGDDIVDERRKSHARSSKRRQKHLMNTTSTPSPFVSAVTWTRSGNRCLSANSEGVMKLLHLEEE